MTRFAQWSGTQILLLGEQNSILLTEEDLLLADEDGFACRRNVQSQIRVVPGSIPGPTETVSCFCVNLFFVRCWECV